MHLQKFFLKFLDFSEQTWAKLTNPISLYIISGVELALFFSLYFWNFLGAWTVSVVALMVLCPWLTLLFTQIPKTTKHWVSQVILGLRVWLNNQEHPIPKQHERVINAIIFTIVTLVPFVLYSLIFHNFAVFFCAFLLSIVIKLWMCDRLVWLYSEMKAVDAHYKGWLY